MNHKYVLISKYTFFYTLFISMMINKMLEKLNICNQAKNIFMLKIKTNNHPEVSFGFVKSNKILVFKDSQFLCKKNY